MKKKHKIWYLEHFQCILMAKNGIKSTEKPLKWLRHAIPQLFWTPLKNVFLPNIFIFRSKKWSKIGPKLVG